MWNISWCVKLFKESSSSYYFCSSLNWLPFNHPPNCQVAELMYEALCKDYCMKLFTVHQIEHVKLLFPQKVTCVCLFSISCILLSEVFVPILPLEVSPSIVPSVVIVPCMLPSEVLLPFLPFRIINFRIH